MTNFLYEMQDELFSLNISVSSSTWEVIRKLIDHIENQGKTLRRFNKAIINKNETITGLRSTIASLNADKVNLLEKIDELNNGIRDSEDLSWKQKYDLSIKEKESAVNALQNKCKYLESQMVKIEGNFKKLNNKRNECITRINELSAENKKLERANLDQGDTIGWYVEDFKKLKEENEKLKERCQNAEKSLENYVIRCGNLEHNYDEEVKMKEQFKTACFRHETTIVKLKEKLVSISQLANEINDVLTSKE